MTHQLQQDIEAGRFRDGDVLPPTKELAHQFGVSDFTVSEGLKPLVEQGFIETKSRLMRIIRIPGTRRFNAPTIKQPQVVLIGGYAGSGKSELGRMMARQTGWMLLDKDTLTRPLVEMTLETKGCSPNDRESDVYVNVVRPREYESLEATVLENLECGSSLITSAPYLKEFTDPVWLQRAKTTITSLNAALTVVWVYCDTDSMHTYIRRRGAARDASKLADWDSYLANLNIDFRPDVEHELVDNSVSSGPLQQQAERLVKSIFERAEATQ